MTQAHTLCCMMQATRSVIGPLGSIGFPPMHFYIAAVINYKGQFKPASNPVDLNTSYIAVFRVTYMA